MKTITILFAVGLCARSAFAEQPTLESLALKVAALERQVEELKTDFAASTKEKEGPIIAVSNREPEIIINILKDGTIRVEGKELRREELIAKLAPILKRSPNQPLRIKADGAVKYLGVVEVIDLCQKAGAWNISFATRKTQADQDGSGQPATRSQSKSEGGDKPQPEAEERSR